MQKWWSNVYKNNKAIVWAALVSILLAVGVLIFVKDEVTRFTLIMPVFAGFILFSILMTPDEELDGEIDEEFSDKPEQKTMKKTSTKKKSTKK
jgi:hypothetical protein